MHAAAVRASPLFNNRRSVPVRLVTSSSLHRRQKKRKKERGKSFLASLKTNSRVNPSPVSVAALSHSGLDLASALSEAVTKKKTLS